MKGEEYTWLITNNFDATTKSTDVTYDQIIITDGAGTDYAGKAGGLPVRHGLRAEPDDDGRCLGSLSGIRGPLDWTERDAD